MNEAADQAYLSDPEFRVYKLPSWRARLYQFVSVAVWGALPGILQKRISACYARLFSRPYSKWLIKPYLRFHYQDRSYLEKFKPPGGKVRFETFQDFFIREFRQLPKPGHETVWPCEGLLCDTKLVRNLETVKVKGDIRTVAAVFGLEEGHIPPGHNFSNVFLHNKNYHRVHVPVAGTITRITHVPGDLVVLRPWIYNKNPSLPAFRNERYTIDITDRQGRVWFLSAVGGPAVGSIGIPDKIFVGAEVTPLQELAVFHLGSTCCMAAPQAPRYHEKNSFVEVGAPY